MSRLAKFLLLPAALVVALATAACGTQRISVPKNPHAAADGNLYHGAVLFSERCSGCHSLSFAGAHGSYPNIRDAEGNSGPSFNQRCERPITRVLYAIENGGFSGAYMPQNIVVGHDAVDVAEFVSRYAGLHGSANPGQLKCWQRPMGSLPSDTAGLNGASANTPIISSSSTSTTAASTKPAASPTAIAARRSHAKKHAAAS